MEATVNPVWVSIGNLKKGRGMIGYAARASDDAANSVDAHLTTCFEINPGILDKAYAFYSGHTFC